MAGCKLYPAPEHQRPKFTPLMGQGTITGPQLPYQFRITSFIDNRSKEETASYTGTIGQVDAFPQEVFTNTLQQSLGRNLYGTKVGTLQLELTHYKLTEYERDFSMSMAVNAIARTDLHEEIVNEQFTCTQDKYRSPKDIPEMLKGAWESQGIAPFTAQGWRDEMTRRLVATCAQNVAHHFAQSALQGVLQSQSTP